MQREYESVRQRGAEIVAIGQGTGAEAQRICRQMRVSYPCVGDPRKESYRAFGLRRGGIREIVIEPMRAGNDAVRKGYKVSLRGSLMRHSDWFQLPGVAIVDRGGVVRSLHRARHAGDLPPFAEVLRALEDLPEG